MRDSQTGMLKHKAFIVRVPFCDLGNCSYFDAGYRKRTRLWKSINFIRRLCSGKGCCVVSRGGYLSPAQFDFEGSNL